jgi:hypothetical protein
MAVNGTQPSPPSLSGQFNLLEVKMSPALKRLVVHYKETACRCGTKYLFALNTSYLFCIVPSYKGGTLTFSIMAYIVLS